ncbi:MAG: hypothetical protein ACJAYD_001258 [Patiriisocius sp.]|jgi:hypothetical protein
MLNFDELKSKLKYKIIPASSAIQTALFNYFIHSIAML